MRRIFAILARRAKDPNLFCVIRLLHAVLLSLAEFIRLPFDLGDEVRILLAADRGSLLMLVGCLKA